MKGKIILIITGDEEALKSPSQLALILTHIAYRIVNVVFSGKKQTSGQLSLGLVPEGTVVKWKIKEELI